MPDMHELTAKLKMLSDAYVAQLPEKFAQMDEAWNRLPRAAWDEEGFYALHRMVHSMTGSGKTFGLSGLSDVARNLEHYLKLIAQEKTAPNEEQRNHILSMMAELRQVAINRDAQSAESDSLVAVAPGNQEMGTRRIVIVEDDVAFAERLQSQLSYFGYDVTVYHQLEDFQREFGNAADAVVIMDISFPEDAWGGVKMMKRIQLGREVPVPTIFITAHDEFEARLEAVRAGGIAYFH
jgi:CheY-like chemotaxis protein